MVSSFVFSINNLRVYWIELEVLVLFSSYGCVLLRGRKMFRYIVALLLVSLYSKSSGAPTNGSGTDLSILLTSLASTCENKFLRSQITNKLNDCHVFVPPYDEKKFQCMLFYDINKQLCAAVSASKLALAEDHTEKIQKEQDVVKLCTTAKDWKFTELGEVYNKYVSVVFNNSIRCARVCSVDNHDIMNVESNFYCKYFKWGAEMLKTQVITAPTLSGTAVGAPVHVPASTDMVTKKPALLPVGSIAPSALNVIVKDPDVVPKPLAAANIDTAHVAASDPALSTSEKAKATENVETNPELPIPELPLNNGVAPTPIPNKPETSGNNVGLVDPNSALSGEGTQNNQVGQTKPEKNQEPLADTNIGSNKPKISETIDDARKGDLPNNSPNSQVDKPNPNDNVGPDDYQNELGKVL